MQLRKFRLVAALVAFLSLTARADDPQQWRSIALSRALAAADTIEDPYRRAETLASIARVQTVVAESAVDRTIHQALTAVTQIREPAFRDWALNDVVLAQIAADDLAGARETANRIEAKRQQGAALVQIATVQLRGGNVAGAQQTAASIREQEAKSEILRQIVAISASRGELDAARAMLRDIDDPFYQPLAVGDIAVAEVRAGRNDKANAMVARVRRSDRGQVLGRIALARADRGDMTGATETLQKIDDDLYRAVMQGRLAATCAVEGDMEAARKMFAAAIDGVQAYSGEPERRALTFAQIGRLQAVSGDSQSAVQTLMRALRAAESLAKSDQREDTLDHIARGLARAGDSTGALQAALRMNDRVARALLVRDVVSMQTNASSASASASAAEFDDPLIEAAAQFGVLGMQLLRTTAPLSPETIESARRAIRNIEEKQPKPAAFAALAAARVKSGDVEQGSSIFKEALDAADAITRNDQRATAYVDMVTALNDRLMFLGKPASEEK
ncbi:MAG TPA: tetratricopeptide repeat protein [Steroidobacteraceae bacterium]|jgi:tetratricopeptide (TPR) repeat protein|nr:tetratricopeptide repeat protein [Steroidobacteraceae bacterium]